MKNYLSWFIVFSIFVVLTLNSGRVYAQQPILVNNQDTTYFLLNPTLETITVTGSRYHVHQSFDELTLANQLNTNFSGVSKDLQRDLPSILRLYTPQGIPLLTKYTSNNSLNSTIPDSAIGFEMRDLGAQFPNPDAPVIIQPNYHKRGNLSLSPLNQTMYLGTDTQKPITGSLTLSHSGAAKMLENLVPTLHAYNTTLAGYGGLRANYGGNEAEFIVQHSQSSNEYSQQLHVEEFRETDYNTNVFINYKVALNNKTLQANITQQTGLSQRNVEETSINYEVRNQIEATSYTIGLINNHTEFRAYYHDIQRIYPYSNYQTVAHRHFETSFSYQHTLFQKADFSLEARFDHNDNEPSASGKFRFPILKKLFLSINGGRIYDAVGSEGLNNLMESVQMDPHPWTTIYGKFETDLYLGPTTINFSLSNKKLHRGWYGESAYINGWILRLGANGKIPKQNNNYFKWNFAGVARDLSLDIPGHTYHLIPGPARLEGHASLEADVQNTTFTIQADTFIGREIRINRNFTGELGPQYFLSFETRRKMGNMQVKGSFNNLLALFGTQNNILAHYSKSKGVSYVQAPPIFNLSLGINLY